MPYNHRNLKFRKRKHLHWHSLNVVNKDFALIHGPYPVTLRTLCFLITALHVGNRISFPTSFSTDSNMTSHLKHFAPDFTKTLDLRISGRCFPWRKTNVSQIGGLKPAEQKHWWILSKNDCKIQLQVFSKPGKQHNPEIRMNVIRSTFK